MKRSALCFFIFLFLLNSFSYSQDLFKNEEQRQAIFRLILTDELQQIYDLILLPADKEQWEQKYWKIFDPTPETEYNEFYAEFLKRFSHASTYYANRMAPFFLDDRGKYFIRFGAPDERVMSSGVGKPYRDNETWAYYNFNLFIDFADHLGFGYREVNSLMDAITGAPSNIKTALAANLYLERQPLHQKYLGFRDIVDGTAGYAADSRFYHITRDLDSEKKMALDAAPPSNFDFSYEKERLDAYMSSAIFRGDHGASKVEIYYSFPLNQLKFQPGAPPRLESMVEKKLTILNQNFDRVFQRDEELKLLAWSEDDVRKQIYINQHTEDLPAGLYNVVLQLESEASKRLAILRAQLNVRDFSNDSLSISDIQFSPQIREGMEEQRNVKPNGILVVPYIGNAIRRANPIYVYFEIYNLTVNEAGQTRFQIAYEVQSISTAATSPLASAVQFISHLIGKKSEQKIGASFDSEGDAEFQQIYLMIDFSKFPTGSCSLTISITDLENGVKVSGVKRLVLK